MNKKTYEKLFCEVFFLDVKDVLFLSKDNDVESGGGLDW